MPLCDVEKQSLDASKAVRHRDTGLTSIVQANCNWTWQGSNFQVTCAFPRYSFSVVRHIVYFLFAHFVLSLFIIFTAVSVIIISTYHLSTHAVERAPCT